MKPLRRPLGLHLVPRLTALTLALATTFTLTAADLAPIFNGKDLSGWQVPQPNPFWTVVDGVLVGENDAKLTGSMLYTEQSYGDFDFQADVRFAGEIDSGFMIRKPELQLQIGTSRSLKRDMTCCFYTGGADAYPAAGRGSNVESLLKTGQWNTFRLRAKGDTFTVWLNGEQVVQYSHAKYAAPGPIGLQIHGGLKMKVEFRNIKARALD